MNNGAFGENFPYSNFHDLNVDWIIKIAKDFLDQYSHIQQIIADGEQSLTDLTESSLSQLQDKADTLEGLLQAWYDTHSADIAGQLADAIADLQEWYNTHSADIAGELADAIANFNTAADTKATQTIATIPSDYTTLSNTVTHLLDAYNNNNDAVVAGYGYISARTGELTIAGSTYSYTEKMHVYPGDIFTYSGTVSVSVLIIAAYENDTDTVAQIDKSVPGVTSSASVLSGTYTVPEGVNYIRFCAAADDPSILKRVMTNELRTEFEKLEKTIDNGVLSPMIDNYGFISSNTGELTQAGSTYIFSKMYKVNPGDKYEYSLAGASTILIIAAYESETDTTAQIDKSIIGRVGGVQASGIYTVPSGVHYIRINGYADRLMLFRRNTTEKSISILFVGNSLTQDGIAYLPYLLKNYFPEVNFKCYMWYNGGYTLVEQYATFNNNTPAAIFSVAENSASWTNYNGNKTMSSILSSYTFDVVCLQGYYNNTTNTDDETAYNNCRNYIQEHYTGNNPLEFISLFHAPKRDNATTIFERTKLYNGRILQNTIAQDMIPIGIAVYKALSTALDSLGDQGHLSPDGTHTQEGLPCLLQTYTALCWLLDKLSINKSVYGFPFKMTTDIYNTINVPGPNLGTGVIEGTDAQNLLAQEIAIMAYKEGKAFVNAHLYSGQ